MYVEVEVDIDLVEEGLENGYIPDGWLKVDGEATFERFLGEDPKLLLLIITSLRKMGYTVEPGENIAHSG